MLRRAALAATLLALLFPAAAHAAPAPVSIGTFATPVHVAAPPGDGSRLFVVEKAGRVQVLVNGVKAAAPFLDVTDSVRAGEEEGLLSIAFAPDYGTSGLFYVFYTDNGGDLVVAEGARSAADPNRGALTRTVFTVPHPGEANHNGGQLAFGPDGLLYVGTGDGGGQDDPGNDAQRMDSLLGKILRIDPRTQTAPAIWALGLRNPWRFSFDRGSGATVIGDVGGSVNEEIDVVAPAAGGMPPATGGNFGWQRCEGTAPTASGTCTGFIAPALNLPHGDAYSGVIGGFVVRDPGLPSLSGRYVFGDLSKGTVLSAALGTDTEPRAETTLRVTGPTSFGEDACGRIYVAAFDGPVYRIQDGAPTPCAGQSTPPPRGQPPAEARACGLRVRGQKRTQRILRRGKRLALRLRAQEPCTVILRAKRFRGKTVVLPANVTRTVRIAPTKRGLRKLRHRLDRSDKRRLRVTVRITARDTAGNFAVRRVKPRVR